MEAHAGDSTDRRGYYTIESNREMVLSAKQKLTISGNRETCLLMRLVFAEQAGIGGKLYENPGPVTLNRFSGAIRFLRVMLF